MAINVEGAAVERELNKTVLPMMVWFYSFGTLAGAGVGMALTALSVPADPYHPRGCRGDRAHFYRHSGDPRRYGW